jgi:hypothetical protein
MLQGKFDDGDGRDGPLAGTKELIAGFWMIAVGSKEEVVEWAMRGPAPHGPVFESADFGRNSAVQTRMRPGQKSPGECGFHGRFQLRRDVAEPCSHSRNIRSPIPANSGCSPA